MKNNASTSPTTEPNQNSNQVIEAIKETGVTFEVMEEMIKTSSSLNSSIANELNALVHHNAYDNALHCVGPICKLLEIVEFSEAYDEILANNHSKLASFMGAGASIIAGSATRLGGASLTTTGILVSPEAPPVGIAAATAGIMLMHKSEEASKAAKHYVPILIDTTLDKFSALYSSAAQFVQQAYQKFRGNEEYSKNQYPDIESAMVGLGYKEYVKSLYANLDTNQQLLYGMVTRDLFNEQFKLNNHQRIITEKPVVYKRLNAVEQAAIKRELMQVQVKLSKETTQLEKKNAGQLHRIIKEQNNGVRTQLSNCVKQANQRGVASTAQPVAAKAAQSTIQSAYQFCEVFNAASQGASLVARIAGNRRVAQKISASAIGVSQVVMGVAQIAQNGWSFGPVGMVLGGINQLIACLGSDDSNAGLEALAEQLAVISKQIHALHEEMLFQFGKVFTALGVINTNIIQGFKLLHEDQEKILVNIIQLQKSVFALQDSVNFVGHKVDTLSAELQGYIVDDERKQLQYILNGIQEKTRRTFNRVNLHTEVMAAFKTYNEHLIIRKLKGESVSSVEITRSLSTKLGSAEANTGLLLNYAKNSLDMVITLPIADPQSWRQCADLLIDMTDKVSKKKNDLAVIGEQDYEDFKHFKEIGENWLALIEQFKSGSNQSNKLAVLFQHYRTQINNLISLIAQEIKGCEKETGTKLKPKYQGHEHLEKQQEFKYEFKRNNYYLTATEDWSGCKGFHNAARFMGYDLYGDEWTKHIDARKKEIAERLGIYEIQLENFRAAYQVNNFIPYYKNKSSGLLGSLPRYSASAFMVSQSSPDTMPLLPLPISYLGLSPYGTNPLSTFVIPPIFIKAEMLGIGTIKHTYQFNNNHFLKNRGQFIYRILFQIPGEKQPIIIRQFNKSCSLAKYLNPAEAIWHAYMGGTYPINDSYKLEERSCGSHNDDYYVRHYCAVASLAKHEGLRQTLELSKETPSIKASSDIELMIEQKVKQKTVSLRQAMNEKVIQNLTSVDTRNAMAKALHQVDASAKILIAFLSILFRDNYQRPSSILSRDEIINFVTHYQGQDVYITHQLEVNLTVLASVEKIMLEQINLQTESAYTPVRETLKKLTQFMACYEQHVLDDDALAAKVKAEKNSETALYGALKAALLIQSELIRSGHIDAASHIAELMAQNGLDLLSLPPSNAPAPAAKRINRPRQQFFAVREPAVARIDSEAKQMEKRTNPAKQVQDKEAIDLESLKYDDEDIAIYLNTMLKHEFGGYKNRLDLELNNTFCSRFTDGSEWNHRIAILPSVGGSHTDEESFRSIDMFLDKDKQRQPDTDLPDHRHDVFDEFMPRVKSPSSIDMEKILFSYNHDNNHWQTGEIIIRKRKLVYTIQVYLHDSFGANRMREDDFLLVKTACEKRIRSFYSPAEQWRLEFKFSNKDSPFVKTRQVDAVSCGVIHVEELLSRIRRESLDKDEAYSNYALELRLKHIANIEKYLPENDRDRINFLAKHKKITDSLLAQKNSLSIVVDEVNEESGIRPV